MAPLGEGHMGRTPLLFIILMLSAALPLLAAGTIPGARLRPALALLVGPGEPAPLPLVHVHAPAGAKLPLLSRFECFSLFFREIDADLHCFGRLAKPGAKRQTHKGVASTPRIAGLAQGARVASPCLSSCPSLSNLRA